jgi:Leucine-rich repeat (LRR) protein
MLLSSLAIFMLLRPMILTSELSNLGITIHCSDGRLTAKVTDQFDNAAFKQAGPILQEIGARRLTEFDLSGSGVSDLSPLRGLTGLSTLDLSYTKIRDLSPLIRLTSLQILNVSNTPVTKLQPLEHLTALKELNLSNTKVSDIVALSGLFNLTHLLLGTTEVGDITPLGGLSALEQLDLSATSVESIASLKGLTTITKLDLSDTKLSDLSPLKGHTALTKLILSGDPEVTDLSILKDLPNVEVLCSSSGSSDDYGMTVAFLSSENYANPCGVKITDPNPSQGVSQQNK